MSALTEAVELLSTLTKDVTWSHGDDLCDCTFQQLGTWTNPYIGKTMKVRMCCLWAELFKQYPEFVQMETFEPAAWDNPEFDMPKHIERRQSATRKELEG